MAAPPDVWLNHFAIVYLTQIHFEATMTMVDAGD